MARRRPRRTGAGPYGALGAPDAGGIRLPAGFTAKVIARSRQTVAGTSSTWRDAPSSGGITYEVTGPFRG